MYFVALSRLKSLSGLISTSMTFEWLQAIGKMKQTQQRLTEEEGLNCAHDNPTRHLITQQVKINILQNSLQ